jgi:ferrous iron transport protein A
MPLTFCNIGQVAIVQRINGGERVRQHLFKLGFVVGSEISVVAKFGNNVIVKVKDSRVAIGAGMASKIMV